MNDTATDNDLSLVQAASAGDEDALSELMLKYRDRLKRMVRLRMNPALQGRVDDSDVIQDAYVEVSKRLDDYLGGPKAPFFLWLRSIVGQKLIDVHRTHLEADMRSANREVSLHRGGMPSANSTCLAEKLLGRFSSPSNAASRTESRLILEETLNSMDPLDREILALRHFEQLSNAEIASVLGLETSTASKRYIRALTRLRKILLEIPGFLPQGQTGSA